MNEQTLINMLSELDAVYLNENFTERDLRNKQGNIFKRAYFYIKSLNKKEEAADKSILMNHWEDYREAAGEVVVAAQEKEEQAESEEDSGLRFSIHVFKRGIGNVVKLISAVSAALLVIIGLLLVIIKRRKVIKRALKKIQISY